MKKSVMPLLVFFFLLGIFLNLFPSSEEAKPELKTVVVEVKYINATWAMSLLSSYMSKEGRIRQLTRVNKLVIEDKPASVEKILSILRELDVKPIDLQFTVDMILGSMSQDVKGEVDRTLMSDPLIRELLSLLKYKSLARLDTSIIKMQDSSRSSQMMGGEGMSFRLLLNPRYIKEGDLIEVELSLQQSKGFSNEGKEISINLLNTALSLKSGERTVVGVSKLDGGDSALILILSGKVIK